MIEPTQAHGLAKHTAEYPNFFTKKYETKILAVNSNIPPVIEARPFPIPFCEFV